MAFVVVRNRKLSMLIVIGLIIPHICSTKLFSTKTGYEYIGNMDSSPIFPQSVHTIFIEYLGRHGARFPSAKDTRRMNASFHKMIPGKYFKRYFNKEILGYEETEDKDLSAHGIRQMHGIGKRFRERFIDLFTPDCSNCKKFKFESTCRSRSIHSMMSFIEGMFNITEDTKRMPEVQTLPCADDLVYRFFDFCPHYISKQKCLKKHVKEEAKFMEKRVINDIIEHVEKLVGLEGRLSPNDIKNLYILCAYSQSLNLSKIDEGVCSLFDDTAFQALEYLLDLKNFYKRGSSDPLNILIACYLYSNIFHSIATALKSCSNTCSKNRSCDEMFHGHFGFAHAETLIPLLGHFELFGDAPHFGSEDIKDHLTAENYDILGKERKYRGAKFAPMGGNVAFVVGCTLHPAVEGIVMVLLNERPISLPCCKGKTLDGNQSIPICTKDQFISCFEYRALNCDFGDLCKDKHHCS